MKKSIWDESYSNLRIELKKIRRKAGLSQTQLAEILQKPQSYVSKYEIGDRNLDFIEVLNVCKACDFSAEELVKNVQTIIERKS